MYGTENRYYQSSGAVPVMGLLLALACGGVVALVLSVIYALVDWYSPLIYLNFLATGVYGFAVGAALAGGLKVGKMRNAGINLSLALLLGLFAVYLSWVWFIWVVFDRQVVFWDPVVILDIARELAAEGLWSLGQNSPPVTGWFLYTVWIVEAVAILLLAVIPVYGKTGVFCERCNRWANDYVCEAFFAHPDDLEELRRDLEEERYEPLEQLALVPANPDDRLHVTIHECPDCSDSTWLTVSRVTLTTDKQGNTQASDKPLIPRLAVPRTQAERFKDLRFTGFGQPARWGADEATDPRPDSEPGSDGSSSDDWA